MTIPRPKTPDEIAEELIPDGTVAGVALRAVAIAAVEAYIESIFAFPERVAVGQRVEVFNLRGPTSPAVVIGIEKHTSARMIPVIRYDETGEERGINPDVLRPVRGENDEMVFVDGYPR